MRSNLSTILCLFVFIGAEACTPDPGNRKETGSNTGVFTGTGGGTGIDGGTAGTPAQECKAPKDCPPTAPFCSPAGICIQCETNEDCSNGVPCTAGFCQFCAPGERRCQGTTVEQCNATGTTWEVVENCPAQLSCTNGQCLGCYPGTKKCDGNVAMECQIDGLEYVATQDCGLVGSTCQLGVCMSPCAGNFKQNTNAGCQFYAVDLQNVSTPDNDAQNAPFAVIVSNTSKTQPADVTLTQPDGVKQTVSVAAQSLHKFEVPPTWGVAETSLAKSGIDIKSSQPITVYQFNPLSNVDEVFSNDASLLLPVPGLGSKYRVMSWSFPSSLPSNDELTSFFTVVGASNVPTQVTITASVATKAGAGIPALSPGGSHTLTLEQGQVLNVSSASSSDDLTGSLVEASGPIAVFGGHVCPFTGELCCCDHLEQQLIPISAWGTEYVISKAWERWNEQDYVRVMASEDGTSVQLDPPVAQVPVLNAGQHHTFKIPQNVQVKANKPILVAQYLASSYEILGMPNVLSCGSSIDCPSGFTCDFFNQFCSGPQCTSDAQCGKGTTCEMPDDALGGLLGGNCAPIGDPAMILAVSQKQFMKSYVFLAPDAYLEDYVNVVAPLDATSITLDGNPIPIGQFQAVGSSGFGVYRTKVNDGVHTIESDKNVGIIVYGYDNDVSYGYPGGMALTKLNP